MHEVGLLMDGSPTNYAGGLFMGEYQGQTTVGHSGKIAGYLCYAVRLPAAGLDVILLSNASYFDPIGLVHGIIDIAVGTTAKTPAKEDTSQTDREFVNVIAAELDRCCGSYSLSSGKLLVIEKDGAGLLLKNLSNVALRLQPLGATRYFCKDISSEIHFEVEAETGGITKLALVRGESQRTEAVRIEETDWTSEKLTALVGRYFSDEVGVMCTIFVREGSLLADHPRYGETELTPTGGRKFSAADL